MQYQVHVGHVEPQLTAVVRTQAAQKDLPTVVPQLCGEVWNFAKAANLPRPGRHVAVYLDCAMNIEVGAEVTQPFTGDGRVVCSSTPSGLVAWTTHMGPYSRLGDANSAIKKWCAANGHVLSGPSWEVYGHWTDDPAQLRTDVFWLVKSGTDAKS